MFGRSFELARAGLAARFEADGDGWLFRARPTSVPVRVSDDERENAIADVLRSLRGLSWGMLAGLMVAVGIVVAFTDNAADQHVDMLLYAATGFVITLFALGWWRAWSLPARRFERRAPAGIARTRDEARDHHIEQLGWGQLLIGGAITVGISASHVLDRKGSMASHWFFGLLGAGAVGVLARTAWRKWRHGQARRA